MSLLFPLECGRHSPSFPPCPKVTRTLSPDAGVRDQGEGDGRGVCDLPLRVRTPRQATNLGGQRRKGERCADPFYSFSWGKNFVSMAIYIQNGVASGPLRKGCVFLPGREIPNSHEGPSSSLPPALPSPSQNPTREFLDVLGFLPCVGLVGYQAPFIAL